MKASEKNVFLEDRLSELEAISDEELAQVAASGNDDALEYLLIKYKSFVKSKAWPYFLIGADREDIIQEGMLGLYKAIKDFRPDRLASFRGFADVCVTRQIISAVKASTRQKHIPLNTYVSLNKPIYDDNNTRTLLDVLPGSEATDPEELMINCEDYSDIKLKLGEILSKLEIKVLSLYLEDKTYIEIAKELNLRKKSIDNALQRIKRKLKNL